MSPYRSRRDFFHQLLKGQIPADAAMSAGDRPAASEDASQVAGLIQRRGGYHLTLTRRAMAAEFQLVFNLGQYEHAVEAGLAALDRLEPLEDMMSFFRPAGELGRVNALAADQEVAISEELWQLLVWCRDLYAETFGAFDITAGALWQVWGFARREGRLPSTEEIEKARRRCGWDQVVLNEASRTVRFLRPGLALNLASVGKGYAVDRLADRLLEHQVADFVIHGGYSSVLARGSSWEILPGSAEPLQGWPIGLADPQRKGQRLGELRLRDAALGTSGTVFQFFYHRGKRYGHILDPRTGLPGDGVLSVTVFAGSAQEADALATAFFVLGPEQSAAVCELRPQVGAIFILSQDSGQFRLEQVGAWPPLEMLGDSEG